MGRPRAAPETADTAAPCAEAATATEVLARRALVFEHMQDGVIITDLDGRIVDWNPAAERIFGYTREEMLGRRVGRLYRVEAPTVLERTIIDTMENDGRWVGELRIVRKDGREGTCETTVAPLLDDRGARIATVGVNRDITERRQMEAALEESLNMMRAVIDGTTDAVFLKDVEGRYVMINEGGGRLLGIPVEEVVGRDDRQFFSSVEAAGIQDIDRRVMAEGLPYSFEETITFEGSPRRLSTTKAPWRDAQGRTIGLIGISRDVTERWKAEENARRHRIELAHVLRVRTVGEMAAGLGHEINQPLGAIANYAEGCIRRLDSAAADPALISALEEISAQAIRAGNIVRRLGEFVRKRPARRESIGLESLVRGALRLIEHEAREEDVAVDLRLDRVPYVRVDPVLIEQVMLNILLNALEAMRGMPPAQKKLSIRAGAADGGMVEVEVSDNGPGLGSDLAALVFDAFFTTKPDGLGMGLAISRSIVEAHGGTLSAAESRGSGATFLLRLPLDAPAS